MIKKRIKPTSKLIKKKVTKFASTTSNTKLNKSTNNKTIISPTTNQTINTKNTKIVTPKIHTGGSIKNIEDDVWCNYLDNVDTRMIKATKEILNISEVMKSTEDNELKSINSIGSDETLRSATFRSLNDVPMCTYNGPNKNTIEEDNLSDTFCDLIDVIKHGANNNVTQVGNGEELLLCNSTPAETEIKVPANVNVLTESNINDTCRDEVTQVINNDNREILDNGKHQEVYDQTTEDKWNEVPAKTNVQTTSDIIAITNVHEAKQNEYLTEKNSVNIDPLIINSLENIRQKTNNIIKKSIQKLDDLIVEDAPMITGNTNYITVLQDEMIGKTLQTTVTVNINKVLTTTTNTTRFFTYQNKNVFILKQKDKQNIEQPLLLQITEKILNHEDARANVLNSKDLEQNVILHYNGIVNKDTTK